MRYLYEAGAKRRVNHIARHDAAGRPTFEPLCGRVDKPFNRTINAPFGLGRKTCRWCAAEVE